MKTLSQTWFADGYIDFELKKYTLLAYLQEISRHFNEQKLYPQLADLIFHYNNIVAFRENKKYLQEHKFPLSTKVEISAVDILNGFVIEENGYFYDQTDVTNMGYWAWKKLAETLPYDYNPE